MAVKKLLIFAWNDHPSCIGIESNLLPSLQESSDSMNIGHGWNAILPRNDGPMGKNPAHFSNESSRKSEQWRHAWIDDGGDDNISLLNVSKILLGTNETYRP